MDLISNFEIAPSINRWLKVCPLVNKLICQRLVQLLSHHPWFKISTLAGSERSACKPYQDAYRWLLGGDLPNKTAHFVVEHIQSLSEGVKIVFSSLPAAFARKIEPIYANAGYAVCSNASAFRIEKDILVIIPEIYHDHTAFLKI